MIAGHCYYIQKIYSFSVQPARDSVIFSNRFRVLRDLFIIAMESLEAPTVGCQDINKDHKILFEVSTNDCKIIDLQSLPHVVDMSPGKTRYFLPVQVVSSPYD